MPYHASEVIPVYLAREFNVSVDKVTALITMTGVDLSDPDFTRILQGASTADKLADLIAELSPLVVLFDRDAFDAPSLDFIRVNASLFDIVDFSAITMESVQLITIYQTFVKQENDVTGRWGPLPIPIFDRDFLSPWERKAPLGAR